MSDDGGGAPPERTNGARLPGLTRRSFVGGLVVLAGCGDLAFDPGDPGDSGDGGGSPTDTPSPTPTPGGGGTEDGFLTVVGATFVPGETFPDDRPDRAGRLDARIRNDADRRMLVVDLMPSFYDGTGQPTHVGTATVRNLDPGETCHASITVRGLGQEVVASRVAGTFVADTTVRGLDTAANPSPLELVAGSDTLAVDECGATVSGRLRNVAGEDLRYAGAVAKLYGGGDLLGNAVVHRTGLDASADWSFLATTDTDRLATTPDDHTVEPAGPWGALGY